MIKVSKGITLPCEIPYDETLNCPDYYVVFWETRKLNGDGPEYRLRLVYRLSGCPSVTEAIEWEEKNANGRESATLLPAPTDDGTEERLFLLHGSYSDEAEVDPDGMFEWELHSQ